MRLYMMSICNLLSLFGRISMFFYIFLPVSNQPHFVMENLAPKDSPINANNYAIQLLVNQGLNDVEAERKLVEKGIDAQEAKTVVAQISQQITDAKRERANKDMLYGALWCVGGLIATVADIGYIFWGAIVFGGIQFFKGVANRP